MKTIVLGRLNYFCFGKVKLRGLRHVKTDLPLGTLEGRILASGDQVLILGSFKTNISDETLNPECRNSEGCRSASWQIFLKFFKFFFFDRKKDFMTAPHNFE